MQKNISLLSVLALMCEAFIIIGNPAAKATMVLY
jgi:hypothetical protein